MFEPLSVNSFSQNPSRQCFDVEHMLHVIGSGFSIVLSLVPSDLKKYSDAMDIGCSIANVMQKLLLK